MEDESIDNKTQRQKYHTTNDDSVPSTSSGLQAQRTTEPVEDLKEQLQEIRKVMECMSRNIDTLISQTGLESNQERNMKQEIKNTKPALNIDQRSVDYSMKQDLDTLLKTKSDMNNDEAVTYWKRKDAITTHGVMYEIKMCMLVFLKLIKIGVRFYLCSNIKEGGNFDDIVACYECKNKEGELKKKSLFIQLKHSQKEGASKCVSFSRGDILLSKYFLWFCIIHNITDENHKIFCSDQSDREYIMMFTNADVIPNNDCEFSEAKERSDLMNDIAEQGSAYVVQESDPHTYQKAIELFQNMVQECSSEENECIETVVKAINKLTEDTKKENKNKLKKLHKEVSTFVTSSEDIKKQKQYTQYLQNNVEELNKKFKRNEKNSVIITTMKQNFKRLEEYFEVNDESVGNHRVGEDCVEAVNSFIRIVNEIENKENENEALGKFGRDVGSIVEELNKISASKEEDNERKKSYDLVDKLKHIGMDSYEYFTSHVSIYCKQKNVNDLEKVLKEEIRKIFTVPLENRISVNLSEQKIGKIYDKLLEEIVDWHDKDAKELSYLTQSSPFWRDIVIDTEISRVSERESELLRHKIKFKQCELTKLEGKLMTHKNNIINIMDSGHTTEITSLKVLQSLKTREVRDYMLVNITDLVNNSDLIFHMWSKNWYHTLVVECPNLIKYNEILFRNICVMLGNQVELRLIIICRENHTATWKHYFSKVDYPEMKKKNIKELFEDITVKQLDEESQQKIFSKEVNFQGKMMKLNEILEQDKMKWFNSDRLVYLLSSKLMILGKDVKQYKVENKVEKYLPRFIEAPVIDETKLRTKNAEIIFAIESCDTTNLSVINKLTMDKAQSLSQMDELICVQMDEGKESDNFNSLCEKGTVHWIKKYKDKFIWKKGKGDISIVKGFLQSPDLSLVEEEILLNDILESPVLITGEPGIGKSALLYQMACALKEKYPSKWIVLIRLSNHYTFLEQIKTKEFTEKHAFDVIKNSLNLTFEEDYYFKLALGNLKNFVVLVDGFDEIAPDYTDKVIKIIRYLVESCFFVYITSRPHDATIIERAFHSLPYKLVPFTDVLRCKYLLNVAKINNDKFDEYVAKELLDKITQMYLSVDGSDDAFTRNPLYLNMLLEICNESVGEIESEMFFNILVLYSRYVNLKIDKLFQPMNELSIPNTFINEYKVKMIETFIKINKEISTVYFDSPVQKKITYFECLIDWLLTGHTKEDLLNVGILNNISENSVNYVHRSFLEYFFALWIMDNYENFKKDIHIILKEKLFSSGFTVFRRFIDLRCVEKCAIHKALILNDKNMIQLISSDAEINDLDTLGRKVTHIAVAYNRSEFLELLIKDESDLFVEDYLGWTPVHYAMFSESWESLDYMLDRMNSLQEECESINKIITNIVKICESNTLDASAIKNLNDFLATKKVDWTPVDCMILPLKDDILDKINFLKVENNYKRDKIKETEDMIFENLENNKFNILSIANARALTNLFRFIKFKIYISCRDNSKVEKGYENVPIFGLYPIQAAVSGNCEKCVKDLIDNGCDVNVTDRHNQTLLHFVSDVGATDLAKLFLNAGCNVNCGHSENSTPLPSVDADKFTPLYITCFDNFADTIKISADEDVYKTNCTDGENRKQLYLTCFNNWADTVNMCNEKAGCNVNFGNNDNNLTRLYLVRDKNKENKAIICTDKCDYSADFIHLYLACEGNRADTIRICSDTEFYSYKEKFIRLYLACHNNQADTVRICVDRDFYKDKNNLSHLYLARKNNDSENAILCLDKGLIHRDNVSLPDHYLSLHQNLMKKHQNLHDSLKNRTEEYYNLNFLNVENSMPLSLGYYSSNTNVVRVRADRVRCNEKCSDAAEYTPLFLACKSNQYYTAKLLTGIKGCDLNCFNSENKTPLHIACENNNKYLVKLLAGKQGCNLNFMNSDDENALHIACRRGYKDIVKLLTDKETCALNTLNSDKESALHIASQFGHTDIVRILVNKQGIVLNRLNNKNETPLDIASNTDNHEMVLILKDKGCVSNTT